MHAETKPDFQEIGEGVVCVSFKWKLQKHCSPKEKPQGIDQKSAIVGSGLTSYQPLLLIRMANERRENIHILKNFPLLEEA